MVRVKTISIGLAKPMPPHGAMKEPAAILVAILRVIIVKETQFILGGNV
jgi:hypothetical protein